MCEVKTQKAGIIEGVTEHYFSETPLGSFTPRTIEVELGGAPRQVVTAGGVFSPENLDRGTSILLRTLAAIAEPMPAPDPSPITEPADRILDIGCGWGAIALDSALNQPDAEVWAIDVNERARDLTRMNVERLGVTNITVAAPDAVPATLDFTEIRSNPPIRVGKEALHGILQQWLPRLQPGGSAYLVVAKHLGAESLQRWVDTEFEFLEVARIYRDKGFHVIQAVRD